MAISYPELFQPLAIGKVNIRNRIAMAPMGIVGLTNPDGSLGPRAIDYYIERARGGVGLIITSVFNVEAETESSGAMHMVNKASLAPFGELCEAVHALGTRIFVQLTAGFGRVVPPKALLGKPVSASAIPYLHNDNVLCRPLTIDEIERIVKAFGDAAVILNAAGVDGIELHGHEGYLFDQFTTAIWNQRTDKYGGNLQGRLTFPVEVLREIKKRAGGGFPVQYRFGLKHYIKGLHSAALPGEQYAEAGRDIPEGLEMAKLLEAAGFDSLHVDAGCYDSWYWPHPPAYQKHGCMADMAAEVKKVVKIPVIAVGRLDVPELAAEVVARGKADMVAIGRGLLADPYWPVKAADGKADEIRPCIGCHEGCIWRFMREKPLSCAVNPACGRESSYELRPAEKPLKVMVVGGGIAGMEAARAAAARGHKVVLYEKGEQLGGHLNEAAVPGFKKDLERLLNWYKIQLDKLDVDIRLATEAIEKTITAENPDAVIIATGSLPAVPAVAGIGKESVITCTDLLPGKKSAGKKVAVIGGGLIGCETALWLAEQGKEVTIIEMLPDLMSGSLPVAPMNRVMLLDLLAQAKITVITGARLQQITDDGIIVSVNSADKDIGVDTVVLATGLKADDTLHRQLAGKYAHIYAIGDCQNPQNIMEALWAGYEVGRTV